MKGSVNEGVNILRITGKRSELKGVGPQEKGILLIFGNLVEGVVFNDEVQKRGCLRSSRHGGALGKFYVETNRQGGNKTSKQGRRAEGSLDVGMQ